jgi:leucyl-tRNA---protein transferase
VTDQRNARIPQFFLTPGGPCPYLPGKTERKVFARLGGNLAQPLSEALTHSGFRRSQSIAYRPACEGCSACVSVRIRTDLFQPSRSQKRIMRRGQDLARAQVPAEATREQFAPAIWRAPKWRPKPRASSSRCCAPIWIRAIPAAA